MSRAWVAPPANVSLSAQQALADTLSKEEKALLSFFGAPHYEHRMSKHEAYEKLKHRISVPPAPVQNTPVKKAPIVVELDLD